MSSDAAYFSNALTSGAEIAGLGKCASERSSEHIDIGQLKSDMTVRSAAEITQVSEVSDELLLRQIRDGEKEALALLFRRHARAVRNVAYRILRNEAEADDLVQEVFLFIFRKASLFESAKGAAGTWIIHVAYHRAFDRRRYLNSRHFYTSLELEDTAHRLIDTRKIIPFHEQSIDGILGRELTARFNARLTPEQRETIQLFFFEGYALREIAQLTGRPLVNVRNHYYRGLERLRKYILPEKSRSK